MCDHDPVTTTDSATTPESDLDIHDWFDLTYANYLVLPRSILQSMPDWWQHRFVAMLRELSDAYGQLEWPDYDVQAVVRREFSDLTDDERLQLGYTVERADPDDDEALDQWTSPDGDEVDTCHDTVSNAIDDPIPHYNRGRTIVPLPDAGKEPTYRPRIDYQLEEAVGGPSHCTLIVDGVVRFTGWNGPA